MNTFEELETWKVARALRIAISKMTKKFPAHEKFRMKAILIKESSKNIEN